MKVVINKCYGGFGLSDKAMRRYAEIKGITLYVEKGSYDYTYWTVPEEQRSPKYDGNIWQEMSMQERQQANERWRQERIHDSEIARDDAALVQVVKELGKEANGRFAALKIVNIPSDVKWEIDEYDGYEHVAEVHRTWD